MSTERDDIFSEAREISDAAQRSQFVMQACGEDAALRLAVEAMLQDAERADAFFETNEVKSALRVSSEAPGTVIGRYKLLEKIGEGGMGVVYMAEQREPVRRKVALKIIKAGMDTRQVVARFEAERQALALMDHPHIAKVLDGGETEQGRLYFVMELVQGLPITRFCDEARLSTRQRLDLLLEVCSAIQHAHQKGIIHRDIKPSNILVTRHGDKPVPRVIDFGIAKATQQPLTDKTLFTQFQHFLGTPAYTSPEQAGLSPAGAGDIDTRSDIYGLGVLLYELLTGTTPFDGQELLKSGLEEMRRTIREKEPPRPSTRLSTIQGASLTTTAKLRGIDAPKLIHFVRGDLDWIVMKCLEKEPARRYETASGLATDIERFLRNEAIIARPPSAAYRFTKWMRRNRVAFAAGASVLAALLTGLGVSTWLLIRSLAAERQQEHLRQKAERAEQDGLKKLRDAYLAQARATRRSGLPGQRLTSLAAVSNAAAIRISAASGNQALSELRNEAIASLALADLSFFRSVPLGNISQSQTSFDPGQNRYAVADAQGNIHVHRISDDHEVCVLPSGTNGSVSALFPFSPDGQLLPVKHSDKPLGVWHVGRRELWMEVPAWDRNGLEFSPDSRRLAMPQRNDHAVAIYDVANRRLLSNLLTGIAPSQVAWSPDGQHIAAFSPTTNRVEVLSIESGEVAASLHCPARIDCAAWHPHGKLFLTSGTQTRLIHVWDAFSGVRKFSLDGHQGGVTSLSFDPATGLVASMSWDGTTRLWDILAGRQLVALSDSGDSPRFDHDGRLLSFLSPHQRELRFYHVLNDRACRILRHPEWIANEEHEVNTLFWSVGFSHDDELLLAGSSKGIACWDTRTGRSLAFLPSGHVHSALFHPHRSEFIAAGEGGLIRWRYDWNPVERQLRLLGSEQLSPGRKYKGACWSASGELVACVEDNQVRLFTAQTNWVLQSAVSGLNRVALSPDGHWVAALPYAAVARGSLWDVRSGRLVHHFVPSGAGYVAFSPDSHWLVTGTGGGYDFWSVRTGEIERRIARENNLFQAPLAFSADGQLLAVTQDRTTVRLLEYRSGRELAAFTPPDPLLLSWLCFNHAGTQLAVAGENNLIQVWDLRTLRQHLAALGLDWTLP